LNLLFVHAFCSVADVGVSGRGDNFRLVAEGKGDENNHKEKGRENSAALQPSAAAFCLVQVINFSKVAQ